MIDISKGARAARFTHRIHTALVIVAVPWWYFADGLFARGRRGSGVNEVNRPTKLAY
jgi:hypothetical protein